MYRNSGTTNNKWNNDKTACLSISIYYRFKCFMEGRLAWDKNKGLGSDLVTGGENELLVEKKGTGIFSRSIMFSSRCLISLSSSSNWWVRSFCEDKCSQGERWWVESRSFFNCLISADKCWIDSFCRWTNVWSESIFLFSFDSKSKENQSSSVIVFAILLFFRKDV